MIEVVNTPLDTAYESRLNVPGVQMAGKTGTAQGRGLTKGEERANYNDVLLPLAFRPDAFFIAFAPTDVPRYAAAIVVEHGNEGAACAAPIVRDLITAAFFRGAEVPSAPTGTVA
jgi:penicillin-binding protein 2